MNIPTRAGWREDISTSLGDPSTQTMTEIVSTRGSSTPPVFFSPHWQNENSRIGDKSVRIVPMPIPTHTHTHKPGCQRVHNSRLCKRRAVPWERWCITFNSWTSHRCPNGFGQCGSNLATQKDLFDLTLSFILQRKVGLIKKEKNPEIERKI